MNPCSDGNEIKDRPIKEQWTEPNLANLKDKKSPNQHCFHSISDGDKNLTVQTISQNKFLAGGQWSQEENADEPCIDTTLKSNCHNSPSSHDGNTSSSSGTNGSKQCFTHNNNLVIEKSNLRYSDDKSCCFYMKLPVKVNNNVYSEKTLNMKDGMEDYFDQFAAGTSSNVASACNDMEAEISPRKALSNADKFDVPDDASYEDEINALNGDEEDEDEGCIYTYKGDNYEANLSHFLQTCFSCGLPTVERTGGQNGPISIQRILNGSPHPNPNPQSNLYSPEMDFLEMDFDPGSNGDGGDSDCEDNNSMHNLDTKSDENTLENFTKMQASHSKKANIPHEIRNLMCRRCELCIYNEQKVNNVPAIETQKSNARSILSSNLKFSLDDRLQSTFHPNEWQLSQKNLNVKPDTSYSNLPLGSGSSLIRNYDVKQNQLERQSTENNLNSANSDDGDSCDDGDEADDERGDDSITDPLEVAHMPPLEESQDLHLQQNDQHDIKNKSFNLSKAIKQLRFSSQNTYSNSSKLLLHSKLESSVSRSNIPDHLVHQGKESYHLKNSNETSENNNLGSISAPEVSPSKEYSPLEKFSRSISFHNQLSSPKYENVCFSHPYKDNLLSSINKYKSPCNTYDYCNCKHGEYSCKATQESDVTNLEACVDRLTQRERSVFNISNNATGSVQRSGESQQHSNNLASNGASSCTEQDLNKGNYATAKDSLTSLPIKVFQSKLTDPSLDLNTVSNDPEQTEEVRHLAEKVMIWTEGQATFRQVSQVGTSACGPTAVINVLLALDHSRPVKTVTSKIRTRLRAEGAPLVDYLLSRSNAGTTPHDLITGIESISEEAVTGRFFHMFPKRAFQLSRWLIQWIKKGGVPVATLNLQVGVPPGQTIPDAWHHQMVFGVGSQGIYLTNPLECVSDSLLSDQLCSDSVILVRRSDIVSRWDQSDKLIKLSLQTDPRWNEMNVLGQVVCVLKEEAAPEMLQGRRHLTSHVALPASYHSGVTIFMRTDNPSLQELRDSPDLPLLDE